MGVPHRSPGTMFYRRDEFVEEASRHPGWAPFHRACGKAGLFFDDIDPIGDDRKDVTKRPRRGYQAVAFRVESNARFATRYEVARGRGDGPIAAVLDAYAKSLKAGFTAPAGLESLFDATIAVLPVPDVSPIIEQVAAFQADIDDIMGLIG